MYSVNGESVQSWAGATDQNNDLKGWSATRTEKKFRSIKGRNAVSKD